MRGRIQSGVEPPHSKVRRSWLSVFRPEAVEIVVRSWRFWGERRRVAINGYVILENHLHLIAAGSDLSKEIGNFKSFTAKSIVEFLTKHGGGVLLDQLRDHKDLHKTDQRYQVWQEGSHPKRIGSDEMMVQKLDYMHNNPVKRGYVDDPIHWRYSSARNYVGMPGLIEVKTRWWEEDEAAARQEPRSEHHEGDPS